MDPSPTDIRTTLRQLRSTTQHLKRAATGLSDEQLGRRPGPDAWSVTEVLAHLCGCADVQGGWIARMLTEDRPTIRYASPRTGMRKTDYTSQGFEASLRGFARQRADLVRTLSALAPMGWSRGATFTGTTPGWAPTVFDVASGIVTHEHAHFAQITATADASKPADR